MSVAVLYSGGVDSLVHLRWAMDRFGKDNVRAIYFDVGQGYAEREIAVAKSATLTLGVPLDIFKLPSLSENKDTGQITFRNMSFILALAKDPPLFDGVVFGMLKAEAPVDKNPRFVSLLQKIIDSQLASSSYQKKRDFTIHTPFMGMTKTQMIQWYRHKYTAQTNLLYSTVACYESEAPMCGQCLSCFNRWVAFYHNGLKEDVYKKHPAEMMLIRLLTMKEHRGDKNWSAISLRQSWKKRTWIKEAYLALNAHTKVQYKRGLMSYLLRPWDTLG